MKKNSTLESIENAKKIIYGYVGLTMLIIFLVNDNTYNGNAMIISTFLALFIHTMAFNFLWFYSISENTNFIISNRVFSKPDNKNKSQNGDADMDYFDKLMKLKFVKDSGFISEEEFEKMKNKIKLFKNK